MRASTATGCWRRCASTRPSSSRRRASAIGSSARHRDWYVELAESDPTPAGDLPARGAAAAARPGARQPPRGARLGAGRRSPGRAAAGRRAMALLADARATSPRATAGSTRRWRRRPSTRQIEPAPCSPPASSACAAGSTSEFTSSAPRASRSSLSSTITPGCSTRSRSRPVTAPSSAAKRRSRRWWRSTGHWSWTIFRRLGRRSGPPTRAAFPPGFVASSHGHGSSSKSRWRASPS